MREPMTRRRVCAATAGAIAGCVGVRSLRADEAERPKIVDPAGVLEQLGEEFAAGTELRRSEHFLVVYDTPAVWARSRTNLLEMTHDRFYASMARAGFELTPLRERLVCVLFERHADFLAYARRKGVNMEWSDGFYASGDNRVVFFASQSKPNHSKSGEQIAEAQAALAKVDAQIAQATSAQRHGEAARLRSVRAKIVARIGEAQQRHARVVGLSNLSQTVHEAAHQLAFNSGLQRRGRVWPFWVSEGIATSFETTHPAGGFGPTFDNVWRRRDLVRAKGRRTLIPWDAFIAMRSAPDDAERRRAAYAQAWALWHVLVNTDAGALRGYVDGLNRGRPIFTDGALRERFAESFGLAGDWGEALGDRVFGWLSERYG